MIGTSLRRGLARALLPPRLLALCWAAQLAVALPAGLLLYREVEQEIGGSLVHERLRQGMDLVWLGEVEEGARGILTTFTPERLGRTAWLVNLEAALWGDLATAPAGLVATGATFALLWLFFLGGAVEHFTSGGGLRPATFFAAAGRNFGRLARLGILSTAGHGLIWVGSRRLFPLLESTMDQVTEERLVLAVYLAAATLLAVALALLELWFTFAKIAAVADGERRAWPALRRAATFLRGSWRPAVGLYLLCGLLAVALLALHYALDPGVAQVGRWGVAAFLVFAQAFLLARLALRLTALAAQSDLYLSLSRARRVTRP